MKTVKIPMRKCVGCNQMFPKRELVRIVKTKLDEEKYEISLDLTGKKNGRGAYICKNSECLRLARKKRRLESALDCVIPDEVYEKLEGELANAE